MEHRYKKLMRRVKAYLLTEQRKKGMFGKMVSSIGSRIYDEHYWKWKRQEVATGAGWGAAAAVSALPLQTFWAILAAWWRRGNIPVAILMAWASPPFFMVVFTPVQWLVGYYVFSFFGVSGSNITYGMMREIASMLNGPASLWSMEPFESVNWWMGFAEYFVGHALTCTVAGLLVYWLVQGIWSLFEYKK